MNDIILSVRGNCGRIHPTFEDWLKCPACETRNKLCVEIDEIQSRLNKLEEMVERYIRDQEATP